MSIESATTEAIVGVQYAHTSQDNVGPSNATKSHKKRKWHWGKHSLNASYDSAATTRNDHRHWRFVDQNSADASATPDVRKKIRSRARYEVLENNPIGLGIVLTLANDTIGTGPRLHMGLASEKQNTAIQSAWKQWAHAINLADKLHTMKIAKVVDGEAIARISVNPYLETPVTLDLKTIECDRLEAPVGTTDLREDYVDGIHLDAYDNAIGYDILRHHPGSDYYFASNIEYSTYDSRNIIHWFRQDRPEQHRGVSECQSALALFALLRRFTLATCSAAEQAANLALVLHTDNPVGDEYEEEAESLMHDFWMDSVELDRNSATILPNGWDIRQISSQHPTTTYSMFKHELIAEISRCLSMPYNIAAANSADHNYASGRLDHQTYHHAIRVERDRINRLVLDRLFVEWMYEAALHGNVLPKPVSKKILEVASKQGSNDLARVFRHTWHWDGFAHSDPVKEAQAQSLRIKTGTTHRALEYAREGRDIDVEDRLAAEKAGLTLEEYRNALAVQAFFNGNGFSGTQSGVIDRETTTETSKGEDTALSNEPPQLKQANEIKRQQDELEETLQAAKNLVKGLEQRIEASLDMPDDCDCDSDDDCDCLGYTEEVTAATAKKQKKKLNKPFRTPNGPKKFGVYVKNDRDNVVLVRFGDPNMEIKRDDPGRRKNFRARHKCDTDPGPKWKARYWSCRMWDDNQSVSDLT